MRMLSAGCVNRRMLSVVRCIFGSFRRPPDRTFVYLLREMWVQSETGTLAVQSCSSEKAGTFLEEKTFLGLAVLRLKVKSPVCLSRCLTPGPWGESGGEAGGTYFRPKKHKQKDRKRKDKDKNWLHVVNCKSLNICEKILWKWIPFLCVLVDAFTYILLGYVQTVWCLSSLINNIVCDPLCTWQNNYIDSVVRHLMEY